MNKETKDILSWRQPPKRLNPIEVATIIGNGITRESVRILSSESIVKRVFNSLPPSQRATVLSPEERLRHIGNPSKSDRKYYMHRKVVSLHKDWLNRAFNTIRIFWQLK